MPWASWRYRSSGQAPFDRRAANASGLSPTTRRQRGLSDASREGQSGWTCKDLLTLKRHEGRTMAGLRGGILARILSLAACIGLNYRLGRPRRGLVHYRA